MILSRYIGRNIISAILIVTLVLFGVEILLKLIREFPKIGTGYYDWWRALLYVLMILPKDLYRLFPIIGLLGGLIGLGILASYNELIAMRASGMSFTSLSWSVLKATLVVTLSAVLIGEVLAPILQNKAFMKKTEALSGGKTLMTGRGIWTRNKNNFIYIKTIMPNGQLRSILRYKFDNEYRLQLASFAKEGYFDQNSWIFFDVDETKFGKSRITSNHFSKQKWDLSKSPLLSRLSQVNSEQISLVKLYRYIQYRKVSELNADKDKFIFWQRFFHPLSIITMIFLSIPFTFGLSRSKTIGFRIVIGAILGLVFLMFNQFVSSMSVAYRVPAMLAAALSPFSFLVLTYFIYLFFHRYER